MSTPNRNLQIHYNGHSALHIIDTESHKTSHHVKLSTSKPQVSMYRLSGPDVDGLANTLDAAAHESELPARSTATFSLISTKVHLRIADRNVLLHKDHFFTRSYKFEGADGSTYYWKGDDFMMGNFRFVRMDSHPGAPRIQTSSSAQQTTSSAGTASATGVAPEDLDHNATTMMRTNKADNTVTTPAPTPTSAKKSTTETLIAKFRNKPFSITDVGIIELVDSAAATNLDDALVDEMIISLLGVLIMVQSLQLSSRVVYGRACGLHLLRS